MPKLLVSLTSQPEACRVRTRNQQFGFSAHFHTCLQNAVVSRELFVLFTCPCVDKSLVSLTSQQEACSARRRGHRQTEKQPSTVTLARGLMNQAPVHLTIGFCFYLGLAGLSHDHTPIIMHTCYVPLFPHQPSLCSAAIQESWYVHFTHSRLCLFFEYWIDESSNL